jgi:DNA-binding transcriptional ArsR family regulator
MDRLLHAIGTPNRREILRIVRRRERSAGEIHRALGGLTFGAVSQHLSVLEAAGLLSVRREGRSRIYAARPEALRPLREWLESLWEEALTRLARLAEAEEAGSRPSGRAGKGRAGAGKRRARRGGVAPKRGR